MTCVNMFRKMMVFHIVLLQVFKDIHEDLIGPWPLHAFVHEFVERQK